MKKQKIYNLVMGLNDMTCVVDALSQSNNPRAQALLNKLADYIDAINDDRQYVWEVEE